MGNIDFIELATFCQNRYKESMKEKKESSYIGTIFVKIGENNAISVSTTPHFLFDAHKCIMIHEISRLAQTKRHSWYKVEVIDCTGEIHDQRLDEEFELEINYRTNFDNQRLLLKDDSSIYFNRKWHESELGHVWALYLRLRSTKNKNERKLISQLFENEESILDMEQKIESFSFQNELLRKEMEMYKELLNQISILVSKKQSNS